VTFTIQENVIILTFLILAICTDLFTVFKNIIFSSLKKDTQLLLVFVESEIMKEKTFDNYL